MSKFILAIALTVFLTSTKSFSKSIICKTGNELKSFKISKNKVSFLKYEENNREIASVQQANSRHTRLSITKTVSLEGKQHIFHIKNKNSFSNLDDYYIIRNSKGHEVIYPLECSNQ